MAVLEGRAPARRPHHVVEDAEVVMSRRRSSHVVFRLGGLGALLFYVSYIHTIRARRHICGACDAHAQLPFSCIDCAFEAAQAVEEAHVINLHKVDFGLGLFAHTHI